MVQFVLCVPFRGFCVMSNPRVQVSIPLSAYRSLKRYCALSECSMSSYLSSLVVAAVPVLEVISDQIESANELVSHAKKFHDQSVSEIVKGE